MWLADRAVTLLLQLVAIQAQPLGGKVVTQLPTRAGIARFVAACGAAGRSEAGLCFGHVCEGVTAGCGCCACTGPVADGALVEVAIEGGAGHLEVRGDLGDGLLAAVVELLGQLDLVRAQLGFAPTGTAAGAGSGQSFVGVGDDEVALELGDGGQHPVDHAYFGGGGVDSLLEEPKPDLALAELIE